MAEDVGKLQKHAEAARVFSPAAPIDEYRLFAGRRDQVREILVSVNQRGRHVVLFGERGVGKTSLANILTELFDGDGLRALNSGTVNCDASDDFSTLWRKVFRELSLYMEDGEGQVSEGTVSEILSSENITPDDIRFLLDRIPQPVMITIDEVDRLADGSATTLLADTIKTLSDHSVDATLIFVGVADSVDQLIAEHQSVERALRQIRMPRMSMNELYEILDKGADELGLTFAPDARERIARLSEGLPTYTHLLALEAVQRAIIDDRSEVSLADVDAATKEAVDGSQQSIRNTFHRAISSPRPDNIFGQVLLACALTPTDFMGTFRATDVEGVLTAIKGKEYKSPAFARHLKEFCDAARGPVLQRLGTKHRPRYRFINPMMQPYVILHGLAHDLISEELLLELQNRQARTDP